MARMMGWGVPEQGWRKGPWTPEEDKLLNEYVSLHGEGRWSSVARSVGLNRSGKSCRLRWVNYLRPGVKRGHITPLEEGIIIELHALLGNKWSTIARYLPGRTDNEIKNYWRTHFKKSGRKPSHDQNQEKRKFHQQRNQENHSAAPEVSPQSEVTSDDQHIISVPQGVHDLSLSVSAYPCVENPCLPLPAMDQDEATAAWSDTVPMDGSWEWLWNLDDQNGNRVE